MPRNTHLQNLAPATGGALIACQECDLLQHEVVLAPYCVALCSRCNAHLYRDTPHGLDRTLALTLSSTFLFILANLFPLVGLEMQKNHHATTLLGAVRLLYEQDLLLVAGLLLTTTVMVPAIELTAMLYILLPLRLGHVAPGLPSVFRVVHAVRPWGMVEVFMLGVLVSVVRLSNFATIESGISLWSFAALMVLLTASAHSFNERNLWACVKACS